MGATLMSKTPAPVEVGFCLHHPLTGPTHGSFLLDYVPKNTSTHSCTTVFPTPFVLSRLPLCLPTRAQGAPTISQDPLFPSGLFRVAHSQGGVNWW